MWGRRGGGEERERENGVAFLSPRPSGNSRERRAREATANPAPRQGAERKKAGREGESEISPRSLARSYGEEEIQARRLSGPWGRVRAGPRPSSAYRGRAWKIRKEADGKGKRGGGGSKCGDLQFGSELVADFIERPQLFNEGHVLLRVNATN
ncbi:hypothetical protein ZWY2020_002238 [Hordeum vulgare]|nr:hypothetical protein ZWY2020_002238 [Hordeum vulgare]